MVLAVLALDTTHDRARQEHCCRILEEKDHGPSFEPSVQCVGVEERNDCGERQTEYEYEAGERQGRPVNLVAESEPFCCRIGILVVRRRDPDKQRRDCSGGGDGDADPEDSVVARPVQ